MRMMLADFIEVNHDRHGVGPVRVIVCCSIACTGVHSLRRALSIELSALLQLRISL